MELQIILQIVGFKKKNSYKEKKNLFCMVTCIDQIAKQYNSDILRSQKKINPETTQRIHVQMHKTDANSQKLYEGQHPKAQTTQTRRTQHPSNSAKWYQ